MIILTSLTGRAVAINADLIESANESPTGTELTLVDGKVHVVSDSVGEVACKVVSFRGAVLAAARQEHEPVRPPVQLRLMPNVKQVPRP